jgi:hypothetical protein
MAKPFEGEAGYRTVVKQDETAMVLDPSLPPPWWTEHEYQVGDIVVNEHRFYRCRALINAPDGISFGDEFNRPSWVEITTGNVDVRDQLPDAVGVEGQTYTTPISPNRRLYVDTRSGPVDVSLPATGVWANGDVIEIIDDFRSFDKHPCTLVANGIRINFVDPDPNGEPGNAVLAVVGLQDYWRFIYYINPGNTADQWLYLLSAPSAAASGGAKPDRTIPIPVAGPTDYVVKPNSVIIARSTDGPIKMTPDDSFQDGDTLIIFDADWQFDTNPLLLLKTDKVVYDPQDADDDGNFPLDLVGPASGWSFLFYEGRLMCVSAPINQGWIDAVADFINGTPEPQSSRQSVSVPTGSMGDIAPVGLLDQEPVSAALLPTPTWSYPIFTTQTVNADVDLAEPWVQYDCVMGRKRTITVNLPSVISVPARIRIRVRMMSTGQGVINVQPTDNDQILGLFGTLNATPKGKARTVHGQYNMIELESDGRHEWMVV